jgi:hypothetical protein
MSPPMALLLCVQWVIDDLPPGMEAAMAQLPLIRSAAMLAHWFERLETLFVAVTFAEAGEFETAIEILERKH